jgi:hypothetical protein
MMKDARQRAHAKGKCPGQARRKLSLHVIGAAQSFLSALEHGEAEPAPPLAISRASENHDPPPLFLSLQIWPFAPTCAVRSGIHTAMVVMLTILVPES